jgi:cell division protein FtsB
MIWNPRERKRRLITWLVIMAVGMVLVVVVFCCGPTGLFNILALERKQSQLQREIMDMKVKGALLRSDIEEYSKPENVKRIARDRLGMVPRADSANRPEEKPPMDADERRGAQRSQGRADTVRR